MKINKDLLPIKGHFFLFNAGTAPLVPYLSTYARQLGFSSATVGVIYTILPIFGLIAKPLFGVIADRFKIQKTLLIIFQAVTMLSFGAIYFIPQGNTDVSVALDCADGSTVVKSCFSSTELVDKCKVASLSFGASTTLCDMNCNMTSPVMWQTVCEHWHLPSYCYSATDSLVYRTNITNIQMIDNCAYIFAESVLLDDLLYTPKCHVGKGYVDVNELCSLNCNNQNLSAAIGTQKANMTCLDNNLNFRVCPNDTQLFRNFSKEPERTECEVTCELNVNEPWRLMEICEGWGADAAAECAPRTADGLNNFPSNLSFIGSLDLSLTLAEHECVYWHLHDIYFPGVSGPHVPYCVTKAQYQTTSNLFHTSCNISCDKSLVNEIIQEASDSHVATHQYTEQFWLFFICMILSWIGMAVVVSIADAICFNVLGDNPSHYGKQRLWGSVGWGIFSLLTGTLIDVASDGAVKNYSVAFILMFVFMIGDVIVSCFLRNESNTLSLNILADVSKLMSSPPAIVFFVWTVGVGLCTGLLWQFLFWHLEDIASLSCDSTDYIKTLQGLVSAIQTFLGEIPFMFLSGFLLKKIDHINMMSLVLFAFGVRFIFYSFLTNPWWVLPIEMFQGITFGMFYPTMASYANVVSPPGTETTIQGLTGAIFEGVGTSLGSLIGGLLYGKYGGWNTFRWFGIGSLIFGVLHVVAQKIIKQKGYDGPVQGYSSVIRFEHTDTINIMEEMHDVTNGTDSD